MTKQEFLEKLQVSLYGLPKANIDERVSFYGEMIDDRVEDGLSEEEAVADIGTIDGIVSEILTETPIKKLVKEKIKPKRKFKAWEIVLLAVGSPVLLPLLLAAAIIVFAAYIVFWSVIVSSWAVFVAFSACVIGGIAGSAVLFCVGRVIEATALLGIAILFAGLSIFAFFGCKGVTKGILILTQKAALGIKKSFIKKEDTQ